MKPFLRFSQSGLFTLLSFLDIAPASAQQAAQAGTDASGCYTKMDMDFNQGAIDLQVHVSQLCALDCAAYVRSYCFHVPSGTPNVKNDQYRKLSAVHQRNEANAIQTFQRAMQAAANDTKIQATAIPAIAAARQCLAREYQALARELDSGTGLKDYFGKADLEFRVRRDQVLRSNPKTCRQLPQFRTIVERILIDTNLKARAIEKGIDCLNDRAKALDAE